VAKEAKPKKEKTPRAKSAYIIFSLEQRANIQKANPTATFGEMGKLIGAAWAALSDKAKEPYQKKSEAEKAKLAK